MSFFSRLFSAAPGANEALVPEDAPFVVVPEEEEEDNDNDLATAATVEMSLDRPDEADDGTDASRSTLSDSDDDKDDEDDEGDSVALSSLTQSGHWLAATTSSEPTESFSLYPSLENFTSSTLVAPSYLSTEEEEEMAASVSSASTSASESHRSGRPLPDDYQQLGSHLFHSSLMGGSVQGSRRRSEGQSRSVSTLDSSQSSRDGSETDEDEGGSDDDHDDDDDDDATMRTLNDKVLDEILQQEEEEFGGLCAVVPPTPPAHLLKTTSRRFRRSVEPDYYLTPPANSAATRWMVHHGKLSLDFVCGLCEGVIVGAWVWNCCGATTCAACVLERAINSATVGDYLCVADPGFLVCPGCHQKPSPQRRHYNHHRHHPKHPPSPCWTPCRALDVAILQSVLRILPPRLERETTNNDEEEDDDDEQEIDFHNYQSRNEEKDGEDEEELAMSLQFQCEYAERLQAWHNVVQRRRREVLLERLKRREVHVWKQLQRRNALTEAGLVLAAAVTLGIGLFVGGARTR